MADYSTCNRCGEKDPILVPAGKQRLCRDCAEQAEPRELSSADATAAVTGAFQQMTNRLRHVCTPATGCCCYLLADEPAADCPQHGYPIPRCDCGRFVGHRMPAFQSEQMDRVQRELKR